MNRVRALLAKKETREYFMSTHFWGPAANWGIPIAAMVDIGRDPKYISGGMTLVLMGYSALFMRFALRVIPKNHLLFACHLTNEILQITQECRFLKYHYFDKPKQKE